VAVEVDTTADGLHAVLEAEQAAAASGEIGAADAVVSDRDAQDSVDISASTVTVEALACLAALVSASAAT
jgi:hypothetical protein